MVRDAVSVLLRGRQRVDREVLKRRSLASLGRFRSGVLDLAIEHDQHLDDALSRCFHCGSGQSPEPGCS